MDDVVVTMVFTFLVTAITMCMIFTFVDRRTHKHDWSGWTEWVQGLEEPDIILWQRQRVCRECSDVQYQNVGKHHCAAARITDPCTHRAQMAAVFDDRTAQLERELGIGGAR